MSKAPYPLSAVETEMLRDMRSRLNRRAISDAAALSLGGAFLQVCARVDIGPEAAGAPLELDAPAIAHAAEGADMAALRGLAYALFAARQTNPKGWNAVVAAGAPQAILSRRLVLGGKEQPIGAGLGGAGAAS